MRACDRIRFNKYYQSSNEFQMAWQVSNSGSPHIVTTTDYTSEPQRGIASIVPHAFAGKWQPY